MKEFLKKNKSFCILVIVIILIVFVGVISLVFDKNEYNVNYFDKIEDFSKLDDYVISEIQNDKYQKNIEVEESYLKKIKYDNKIYIVRAYIFEDTESSQTYFERYTKKKCDSKSNYYWYSNPFKSYFIAYNENCLYCVEGGYSRRAFIEFVSFLNSTFPIKADFDGSVIYIE